MKHTIAIVGRLFSLARPVLPHPSFENRAIPLYTADKSNQLYCDDGWLLHTICFYGSNERQGISIFAFTDSVGQTPPFHSTKSLLNAASMRGFTNRMYAVSPLPPSLLVCAHFHHGRISRGSRCEGGRASIRPAAQTGVAYPINANIRGEQASKNLFGAAC